MTGSSRRVAAALALVAALGTAGCGAGHAAGNGDGAPVRYSDTPSLAPGIPARQSPTPTPTSTENPSPTGVPTR